MGGVFKIAWVMLVLAVIVSVQGYEGEIGVINEGVNGKDI